MKGSPVTLTHDLVRTKGGTWRCMNCGALGATIGEVNAVRCPCVPEDNRNVLNAIVGARRGGCDECGSSDHYDRCSKAFR